MPRTTPTALSVLIVLVGIATAGAQRGPIPQVPRLWTAEALAGWALPIAGVKATANFYSEAEYYAAPIDEVRTYPVYIKSREPAGYRERIFKNGPQPLVDVSTLTSEAAWVAAGHDAFEGFDFPGFRTADPRAFQWADDPELASREHVTVGADGTIPGVRWLVDHDGVLKITMTECGACHSRVLPDGRVLTGAQANLELGSLPDICNKAAAERGRRLGLNRGIPPNEEAYESYGVPWLKNDINARLKTMSAEEVQHAEGPGYSGTFTRFNARPLVHDEDSGSDRRQRSKVSRRDSHPSQPQP
jgi:hypothetical protein